MGLGTNMRAPGWITAAVALVGLIAACTSDREPELPPSSDTAVIAARVMGAEGQAFLSDLLAASWDDDGRRAGELFAWIPRDAQSDDPATSARAGETAHAIASFLADERDTIAETPANSDLWRSFADSLIPYLGALVGDDRRISGFASLDGLNSQMRRAASLFAAMTKDSEANCAWVDAADAKALEYEQAFAKAAVADPLQADSGDAQRDLLRAARLRSLVATGDRLANPDAPRPVPTYAETAVMYQVASLTARDDDPHINEKFFRDGRLLPIDEIPEEDRSIYRAQLRVYLVPWPQIGAAIERYARTYSTIANGQ